MDSASPAGSPESWMIMLPNRRRSSGRSSRKMGSRAGKGSIQVVLVAANPGRAVWSPNASRPVTAVMAAPKLSQTICDRRKGADLGVEPFRGTPNSARSRDREHIGSATGSSFNKKPNRRFLGGRSQSTPGGGLAQDATARSGLFDRPRSRQSECAARSPEGCQIRAAPQPGGLPNKSGKDAARPRRSALN